MRAAQLFTPVLLLSLISVATGAEQNIQWLSDLEAAKRIALQTNRPILVHFWSQACDPCVKLEQLVFALPEVKREMEANFVLVKLNVDNEPGTAVHFGVRSWPTDVILAPDGRVIARLSCPQVAGQYLAQLAQVRSGVNPYAGATLVQNSAPAAGVGGPIAHPPASPAMQQHQAPPAMPQQPAPQVVASPAPPRFEATELNHRVKNYDWRDSAAAAAPSGGAVGSAYAPIPSPAYGASAPPASQSPSVAAASFNSIDPQSSLASNAQQASGPSEFEMVPAQKAPPVGLDGCCPVDLMRVKLFGITDPRDPRFKYTRGDPRYGAVHRGRTYLFSGPAEQQEFLRAPDRYSPAMSGYDPVLYVDEGRQVDGTRKLGLYFGDRIYLFATEESQARFRADMRRYADVIYQAEHSGRGTLR